MKEKKWVKILCIIVLAVLLTGCDLSTVGTKADQNEKERKMTNCLNRSGGDQKCNWNGFTQSCTCTKR